MSKSTERQIQLGLRQRRREEADLCDEVEAELQASGLLIAREYPTQNGRVDIAVIHPTDRFPMEFIEAKVQAPLAGIGQLLAYQQGLTFTPRLTLVVPPALHHLSALGYACGSAGVRLWEYEPPAQRERRERFEARTPVYESVSDQVEAWHREHFDEVVWQRTRATILAAMEDRGRASGQRP